MKFIDRITSDKGTFIIAQMLFFSLFAQSVVTDYIDGKYTMAILWLVVFCLYLYEFIENWLPRFDKQKHTLSNMAFRRKWYDKYRIYGNMTPKRKAILNSYANESEFLEEFTEDWLSGVTFKLSVIAAADAVEYKRIHGALPSHEWLREKLLSGGDIRR